MKAKILNLDIENAPNLVYSWTTWSKGSWRAIEVVQDWYILCVGYKWYGKKTECVSLIDFPGYKKHMRDERRMLKVVWDLLDEADIVIGWNSMSFDIKKLNSKFLKYGFGPPSPYKQIDVMREKRRLALSNSNKLDDTSEEWGTGRKLKHQGFPLWSGCMAGDMRAWRKMIRYCIRDVAITEKNYKYLRPWMATHPNLNGYSGFPIACPACQTIHALERRGKTPPTPTGRRRQRYHCSPNKGGCGKWSQGPLIPVTPNQKILIK